MTKNIGMILLACYLLLIGVMGLFGLTLGGASFIVPVLACAAAIFIFLGR